MMQVKKLNNFSVEITNLRHTIISDAAKGAGGNDDGPDPHELLEASLGACTSITVMMYARRKNWPLVDVLTTVKIISEKNENIISREINLIGELDDEQRSKLMAIANKCPMHNFLGRKTIIETKAI